MLADYHIHTYYSDDSTQNMEEAIKYAIQLGLDEICFTDHVDYGVKTDLNCDCESYLKEIRRYQSIYQNQIKIKFGIEFGVQVHTVESYETLFSQYPFDFVLLSCHQVDDKELWTQDYQNGKTQDEYQLGYYNEILQVIKKYNNYSVLAHLDMMKRYDKQGEYPFEKIKDIVTEILKLVIKNGKGIEINTSSFRYKLSDLTPCKDILKLYYDLGGEIITIGSDAHKKEQINDHREDIVQVLKQIGFKHIYTFENMQPIAHEL